MYKNPKRPEEGFVGYCKDLAEAIAKKLGINCKCSSALRSAALFRSVRVIFQTHIFFPFFC